MQMQQPHSTAFHYGYLMQKQQLLMLLQVAAIDCASAANVYASAQCVQMLLL